MTNLDRIEKAWSMGWSATINYKGRFYGFIFLHCGRGLIAGNKGEKHEVLSISGEDYAEMEITGYKYAGELAGNIDPSSKTIFKAKDIPWNEKLTGKLVEYEGYSGYGGYLIARYKGREYSFDKSEIEPYFN